ncbi:hypothetical protein NQ317_005295 [Molorchus minor]|uniref:Uncharacterized protein n=1 Tax=Molorchus minor TaxID=1323400 RepID=A0ABQ9JNQ1_9CUCU|nr:hypothetical protein NQ317_005295 [Molorchus minor]
MIRKFTSMKRCKIREFVKFIGVVVAACPAVRYGWVYSKYFERDKCFPNRLGCNGNRTQGFWDIDERKLHINQLELLAAFFWVKCFASELQICNILCRIDNTTAIAYINRIGGIQYPSLNDLSRSPHKEWRRLSLVAGHLSAKHSAEKKIPLCSRSTFNQYESTLKNWWLFCKSNSLHIFVYSISAILSFLTVHYEQGASYGTLNTYRSANSLIISPDVGRNPNIKRFFKGVFRHRPTRPKYGATWYPAKVLTYISSKGPNEGLNHDYVTRRLATLLALTTVHRVQTLALIDTRNINIGQENIQIRIPDEIKTVITNFTILQTGPENLRCKDINLQSGSYKAEQTGLP